MRSERISRIIGYALNRQEAYLSVGLTFVAVVVAILRGWPWWVMLACAAAGALLLGLLVIDSLADPSAEREAALADVDLSKVHDKRLKNKLQRAIEYVHAAQRLAKQDNIGALDGADDELPQLEQAVRAIFQMSLRLQEYGEDRLIQRDLLELQKMASGSRRLTEDQKAQLETLRRLDDLVRTAEREIDDALANLGRSYAEMKAIGVTPELRGGAAETLDQLTACTQRLSELAAGYDDAYGVREPHK